MSSDSPQLGPYFDGYIAGRTDLGYQTIQTLTQARNAVVAKFGGKRDMASITIGDAKDHRIHLARTLSQATIAMHVKKLRQVWRDAMDRKLLTENPWKSVRAGTQVNESRQVYVPVETILKVIDHCPSLEWKLLFALARFAGMRIPSEPRCLKWDHVGFDTGKIIVHSPKTKHHPGKELRVTPLFRQDFPDLERLLMLALGDAAARDGSDFVLGRLRLHRNIATAAKRIVRKAGFKTWPKFWQNLRSSCETDLAAKYPIHVVCSWIGNSIGVAKAHYLQVTEADYDAANTGKRKSKSKPGTVEKTPEIYELQRSLQERRNLPNSIRLTQAQADSIQKLIAVKKRELAAYDRMMLRQIRRGIDTARGRR